MITRRSIFAGITLLAVSSLLPFAHQVRAATPWDWWSDLLNYRPDAATLHKARFDRGRDPASFEVQRIEAASGEHVNFDYYAVQILELPKTGPTEPLALMAYVRRNLHTFLDEQIATVYGYSQTEADDWWMSAPAPLGGVMVFKIPAF